MNKLAEKQKEVNAFLDFIREEEEKDELESLKKKVHNKPFDVIKGLVGYSKHYKFIRLIPKIQLSAVLWKIQNQYNNNLKSYVKAHPLFVKCFTEEMKHCADGNIEIGERDKKKNKKEFLLYSSQLLGLVGKNGRAYINDSLLDYYKKDFEDQERYLEQFRLVNNDGKISKFTSLQDRQRRKLAQLLNLSACMSQMAHDKGFVFSFVTLTLPGSYHPSPAKGQNTFNGVRPSVAHKQLHHYWKLIRARLAKAGLRAKIDYFGIEVSESHKDSCLHLHSLIYTSKEHQVLLENIVNDVANKSHEYVKFDFKKEDKNFKGKNGKSANGASYIFKYLTKTNATITDDTAIKNIALRWLYSARGYNFFGLDSSLSKFEFVCKNREEYKNVFCAELNKCLIDWDYYTFVNKFSQFFKVYRKDSKIEFVTYNLDGNNQGSFKKKSSLLPSKFITITKKIFGIFEATGSNDRAFHMIELDENLESNAGAFGAWSACKTATWEYSKQISAFEKNESLNGSIFLHHLEEVLFDDVCDMVETKESDIFIDEELFGDLFQPNKLKTNFSFDYLVTIKPNSSSEEQIDKSIFKDKHKKSLYYEKSKKLKEVNEYLKTKIIVGDGRKEDFYLEMMFSQLETIEKILTN
ncbi:replication endonuclease [Achromobacter xylosoxidans]